MSEATPRPWSLQPQPLLTNDGSLPILAGKDDERNRVALVDCQAKVKRGQGWQADCEERDANAALIVTAVNSHDAMRQALERFAGLCQGSLESVGGGTTVAPSIPVQWIKDARAALAQAKETP